MTVAGKDTDQSSATPHPTERPAGYQRWHDLLFLHWRISPAEIGARIPEPLSVDTFEGSAWVGLIPFWTSGVRPWWSPSIPFISKFPETNVRTYVRYRGRDPGVWFLSLDAGRSLAAKLGRSRWGLPYYHSAMKVRRRGSRLRYTSDRLWTAQQTVGGTMDAEVGELFGGLDNRIALGRAVPGSLEHFLVERYLLYSQIKGRLFQGRVVHTPYPLRDARLLHSQETLLSALGLKLDRPPDHVIFSEGVSTEIMPLRPV
jgi:uncharacterized protein YqjF (DUF2071 family)